MGRFNLTRRQVVRATMGGLAFGALGGCGKGDPKPEAVRLRQEWFPFSGFAGEMLAAKKYASKAGVNLSVQAGGQAIDPIKTVLADQDQLGVVSGDILLTSIAEGAPIVAIGVVNDRSPTCFIVRKDSNIKSIADFRGKRVGVLQGTNTQKIYELLLLRNHVDRGTVKEIDIPFELQTFMLGEYDVRPAFVYDEPITLDRSDFAYEILYPENYGVNFVGTVYFTSRKTLSEKRAPLVATLTALIQGWRDIATNEGRAEGIRALKEGFNEIDESREAESLGRGYQYFLGPERSGRPLSVSDGRWQATIAGLEELDVLKKGAVDFPNVWYPQLLDEAYARIGR
jgi:ABC-type nitrate/sulfonate/bicarbonate transport system substrate-binding protein